MNFNLVDIYTEKKVLEVYGTKVIQKRIKEYIIKIKYLPRDE